MSLVELELRLETPLFAGGHDPLKLDELWFLRPSGIKGVWRWWARALVAGALYDAGQLEGQAKSDILRAPTREEDSKIAEIVGIKMGLGYAGPQAKLSTASKYSLVVDAIGSIDRYKRIYRGGPVQIRETRRIDLQRATLLALGLEKSQGIEYLVPGARFQLKVEEQLEATKEAVEAALSALSLALILSCFGKGGRRGLGCFEVRRARGRYAYLFDARVPIAERIWRGINAVRRLIGIKAVESGQGTLPPLSSVSSRELAGGYKVGDHILRLCQVIEVRGEAKPRHLETLLGNLHNFFLRGYRTRKLFGDYCKPDTLRQRYVAWILGLPREQRGTG